jgi:DNA-binding LytR/AlgR family response regulator
MTSQKPSKKIRVIKPTEHKNIIYIKHLGKEPYNEVKFECGKKLIVSYSLTYWQTVFQDFQRINRKVLINPDKIISENGIPEVELSDNSKFLYSRRRFKDVSS